MPTIQQTSFAAGEVAPELFGRVDLNHYHIGLKTCRNAFVSYHGGVLNRPGTKFVAQCKDNTQVRLIPFAFNTEQTYVLEFGNRYIRFHQYGGPIESSPGVTYEIATPYTEDMLFDLRYVQSADVMTLTHPRVSVRELRRLGQTNWQLASVSFTPGIGKPAISSVTGGGTGSETYSYQVTAVSSAENREESLPSSTRSATSKNKSLGDNPITINWGFVSGAKSFNVYKQRNGLYGYIGSTESRSFKDDGIKAEVDDTPPDARNPFNTSNRYPATATYFQQRLAFASTTFDPQTMYLSKSGAYANFGFSIPPKDDDSITFTIASRQVNEIRHLIPLRDLVVLTSGGEWRVFGGENSTLTPTSLVVQPQSYYGASKVPPLLLGNRALYVQEKGSGIRDIGYSFESDGFSGQDLTLKSPHLFKSREIVDWCFSQVPGSLVWGVRNDGVLLSCAYVPEQQVVGWSRHDTDGKFESVCSVAEGNEDAVYVVVLRDINGVQNRYIERFETRDFEKIEDAFFVDSGLSYNGEQVSDVELTAEDYTTGSSVTASLIGDTWGVDIEEDLLIVYAGDQVVRLDVRTWVDETTAIVEPRRDIPLEFREVPLQWDLAKDTFGGLGHLEGKELNVLADGNVEPRVVVENASVKLQHHGVKVHLGLPFETDIRTMDIAMGGEKETERAVKRVVTKVNLTVKDTRGVFAGRDESSLREVKPLRAGYLGSVDPITGFAEVAFASDFDRDGSILLRQSDPLPMHIVSIMPEVEFGG